MRDTGFNKIGIDTAFVDSEKNRDILDKIIKTTRCVIVSWAFNPWAAGSSPAGRTILEK